MGQKDSRRALQRRATQLGADDVIESSKAPATSLDVTQRAPKAPRDSGFSTRGLGPSNTKLHLNKYIGLEL